MINVESTQVLIRALVIAHLIVAIPGVARYCITYTNVKCYHRVMKRGGSINVRTLERGVATASV
jgi:hypothetical protein